MTCKAPRPIPKGAVKPPPPPPPPPKKRYINEDIIINVILNLFKEGK